ncbi:MAG: TIGR01777 family protein [Gammaproteobacteria bacterium]|jgi:uncharacterized protein (TIGR01777 family)|nr:TIGR01777 family protein [Gammaproteobacteria bacterium]MBP6053373.1 TIGR01777 family oxidoreductase [Pseudomonadales bacterium]MBK6583496.1 TIGR01777 family protein [Gammaproteobacteria bacterium]MBK7171115.1 TIGR01777 family protein [Gammaproteobacteria bacterium]MBK7727693.1 TIGR01777 family protein [Gammaproteobacteria bacterium]
MQRYLVTGGTGFVGRALCQRLAERGAELTVLSRDPRRASGLLPAGTRTIGSLDQLSAMEHFDVVLNLAGEPIADKRWSVGRKRVLEASRIELTRHLVRWMLASSKPPRVFVSASAIGYYGDQGEQTVTEDSPPHCEYSHELCAAWEAAALRAASSGIRTVILRIGLVVAPGGGFLARMLLPFRLGVGGPIGNGRQWMSWIHRRDLLRLIELLSEREELAGVFNATAPTPVTGRQFAHTLGRVLHRPAILPIPALVLRIAFGEMSRLLLTGQRVFPVRAEAAGFEFEFRDLESALRDALADRAPA